MPEICEPPAKPLQMEEAATDETETTPPDSVRPRKTKLTTEELADLVTRVISGTQDVADIDPAHLPALIGALKEDRDDKICHHRADEAEDSDRALHKTRQFYNNWQRDNFQRLRVGEIRARHEQAVNDLAERLRKRAAKDEAMRLANAQRREALLARQADELAELRENWRTPAKVKFFNRTSPALRALRLQSILLLNDHRYPEMRAVDRLADAQEDWETDLSHHTMNAQYIYAQQLLEKKHEREIRVLVHAQDVRLAERDCKQNAKIAVLEKRVQNLKRQLDDASDPAKVWNLFRRNQTRGAGKKAAAPKPPPPKNLYYLTLPPLQGPQSARRRAASKRKNEMSRFQE
jgi:hypothetical protein